MDRTSVTICRIYAALNSILTTDLTEDDLNRLENDIINYIDSITGKETVRYSNNVQIQDNKNSTKAPKILKEGKSKPTTKNSETPIKNLRLEPDSETLLNDASSKLTKSLEANSLDVNTKQKRVRWDCKSCMNVSFKDSSENSVCTLCKNEFSCSGKTNTYYQRHPKDIPSHCGSCNYAKYDEALEKYICTVNYFESDKITNNIVRANYMNKNKPNFCRM